MTYMVRENSRNGLPLRNPVTFICQAPDSACLDRLLADREGLGGDRHRRRSLEVVERRAEAVGQLAERGTVGRQHVRGGLGEVGRSRSPPNHALIISGDFRFDTFAYCTTE